MSEFHWNGKPVYFANQLVPHYQDTTEPTLYPQNFTAFVPKSELDSLLMQWQALAHECQTLNQQRDEFKNRYEHAKSQIERLIENNASLKEALNISTTKLNGES